MATENPTGRGAAVALKIPADQVQFLRGLFEDARAGVLSDLKEHSGQLREPARQRREEAAYGRLLIALDELAIDPDCDVRGVVGDLAQSIDAANEYSRVVSEHDALHGLLAQLTGGDAR